ncbi:SulP family inorganic anion transporter [Polluticoccus soli]|uniref:SulP family inorganic anion transporter n=1 Tax=Polluticoccus soli TaxID=3034150 RepID=UPI0023E18E08|nr:SulP family inorganic anion transporter [Flavipsychrobacter sp. JY13-12]
MNQKVSFFSSYKKDLLAGLIVFLIALPLCLGIAQASGAPLFAGIVAGIVGGLVIGALSGSALSVVGPAAGLTAIVLVAINDLGAFDIFLCAVMVAGAVQLVLGFLKAGSIANYFPNSVIEGMLAGIGLTIILKQLPEAVGYEPPNNANMMDADDGFQWTDITGALEHIQPGAAVIALVGLAILVLWTTKPFQKLKLIPSGLLVVVLGVLVNELFKMNGSALALDTTHLVNLPIATSASEFVNQFTLPDFAGFTNPKVWQTGAVIAIVASIETLLCIEATDKLDPLKRYTPTNRELKAQGIGNMVSGLLGGLPVTSVIVRSSANINAGARTKLSTIVHGTLLLICVAAIPATLNLIPKAALAAILIFTGYRLCNPSVFKHMWKEGGLTQFIPFVVTAVAVVSLDLLKGVAIGMCISIFYILRQNMRIAYYFQRSSFTSGELIKLNLAQEVSFLNKASIKQTLENLPKNSSVIIDASNTEYIDFDVLDLIRDFDENQAPTKNIKMSLVGFKNTYKVSSSNSEKQLVSGFVETGEVPKRTSGSFQNLIKQLTEQNDL